MDCIGFGITIVILNNRDENITVFHNETWDFIFLNILDSTVNMTYNLSGNDIILSEFKVPGITYFSIAIEGGNTKLTRKGMSILNLIIFND